MIKILPEQHTPAHFLTNFLQRFGEFVQVKLTLEKEEPCLSFLTLLHQPMTEERFEYFQEQFVLHSEAFLGLERIDFKVMRCEGISHLTLPGISGIRFVRDLGSLRLKELHLIATLIRQYYLGRIVLENFNESEGSLEELSARITQELYELQQNLVDFGDWTALRKDMQVLVYQGGVDCNE